MAMDISLLLYITLFLLIVAALIAIETQNLLSSIISMGSFGFVLSITYLLLGAPEIAIVQIMVEIIVLIILIRATINRDLTAISGDREFFGLMATLGLLLVFSLFGLRIFNVLPQFGMSVLDRFTDAPSSTYLAQGVKKTGSTNIVESIILDFRSFDTLAAITVFFCGIIGALSLLRRKSHKNPDAPDLDIDCYETVKSREGMSMIVKTVTRWLKGFLLLFGIYLILFSHASPGGGFAGGIIIACSLILVILAKGQKKGVVISRIMATLIASMGAIFFLAVSVFDVTQTGKFFKGFIVREGDIHPSLLNIGTLQLGEIGIGLMVSAALYLVFSILASLHIRVRDGNREMVNRTRD